MIDDEKRYIVGYILALTYGEVDRDEMKGKRDDAWIFWS